MQKQDIETILASQRKFFATGKTLPVSWRLEQLKKLRTSMLRHEEDLYGALKKDLGKSRMESYMCEIGLTLSELTWMEKHIRRLTREKRVPTPLAQFSVSDTVRHGSDHESLELSGTPDTGTSD